MFQMGEELKFTLVTVSAKKEQEPHPAASCLAGELKRKEKKRDKQTSLTCVNNAFRANFY